MPVAGTRAREHRVEHVVVRRTVAGDNGIVQEVDHMIESRDSATQTVDQILNLSNERRDDRDDQDYDSPPPIRVTMTIDQPQPTGTRAALGSQDPSETTVVVTISPPPKPHKGGISQTTEHLLIAAGSIGATIIVVMVMLAIHTMRKRGMSFKEAVKHGKYQVTRRGPPPPPKRAPGWNKPAYSTSYGSMTGTTVTAPQATLARTGSNSSSRPLMASRNGSLSRQVTPPGRIMEDVEGQSFLLDSPPSRTDSHRRNISGTPSSPVLPLQNQRGSQSTRNTRSMTEGSELRYPEPPQERALSPLPPPPTFKQFLSNRRPISARPAAGPMISRFSWTNSNAPQTPHDPSRDTNSHTLQRDSFMTQRSSVPRFRTIDSWVNQQANRLEEQKLKDQLNRFTTSTTYSVDDERYVPEVPMLPKNVEALRESSRTPNTNTSASTPPKSPPNPPAGGLPGKNIKHERHDTHTTVDTAPIFRQHPGQEVRFSTRSLVPSEILNTKMKPSVL